MISENFTVCWLFYIGEGHAFLYLQTKQRYPWFMLCREKNSGVPCLWIPDPVSTVTIHDIYILHISFLVGNTTLNKLCLNISNRWSL
ncbi:MAG: hypothetical protein DRO11_09765 [Methanobacteriota archaeon]|nr:MAG: hypothetical protein DRO11_09765 [Euryarchaeota archaeon]